ncbi:hypothetical protein HBB16_13060 [Pseudonocardia sp. MCCB 268]|nr:hypothetical protein [Pseudonocardia cytotoxica]
MIDDAQASVAAGRAEFAGAAEQLRTSCRPCAGSCLRRRGGRRVRGVPSPRTSRTRTPTTPRPVPLRPALHVRDCS